MKVDQLKINKNKLTALIRNTMEEKNLTDKVISEEYGIKYTTFRNWRRGVSLPSTSGIEALAKIVEFPLDELLRKITDLSEKEKDQVMKNVFGRIAENKNNISENHGVSLQSVNVKDTVINVTATHRSARNVLEMINQASRDEIFVLVDSMKTETREYFREALETRKQALKSGLFTDFSELI
jgi:transcriptional regulator with XRE-family HTH domain